MTSFLLLLVWRHRHHEGVLGRTGSPVGKAGPDLFTVSAASGAIATMIVGSLPDVARAWADAKPALKPGYVAVYDALGDISGGVFAVSWASFGLFGIVFRSRSGAAATSRGRGVDLRRKRRRPGRRCRGGRRLPHVDAAFLLLVLGLLLSYVVIVAASVKVWALAARPDSKTPVVADPVGNGATP